MIYVQGGNTDYLTKVFRETGFDKLLKDLLETKVYVGSSAGAMVLGKRINTPLYREVYGAANDYGVTEYLGIVELSIMPHINSPEFANRTFEAAMGTVSENMSPVYLLDDNCAVRVVDGDISVVGEGDWRVIG